jgi:hypothetical protein
MDEIDHLAAASGMPIPAEYRDGVLRQWRLNQQLAAPLLAFDLPGDMPPAPTFAP